MLTDHSQVVVQEGVRTVGKGDSMGVSVVVPRSDVEADDTGPREGVTYTEVVGTIPEDAVVDAPSVGARVTVTVGMTTVVTVSHFELGVTAEPGIIVIGVIHSTDVTGADATADEKSVLASATLKSAVAATTTTVLKSVIAATCFSYVNFVVCLLVIESVACELVDFASKCG